MLNFLDFIESNPHSDSIDGKIKCYSWTFRLFKVLNFLSFNIIESNSHNTKT